jgi:hypothetical protein
MKKYMFVVLAACLVLLLAGCGPKPDQVALDLAEALNAGDLEAALALFAEDAVVTSVNPEPYSGKAEIQAWLEGMIADGFQLTPEIVEVVGNKVIESDSMSMDSMSFYGIETLTGQTELVVEDGLIQTMNFSWSEETLADLMAAPFVAPEDLIGVWSVGTYMKINQDGTARVAYKLDDLDAPVDADHPGSLEEWTYDGMVMTMQVIKVFQEDGSGCSPDELGVYYIRWAGVDGDRLKFKPISDECGDRRGGLQWGDWRAVEQ